MVKPTPIRIERSGGDVFAELGPADADELHTIEIRLTARPRAIRPGRTSVETA